MTIAAAGAIGSAFPDPIIDAQATFRVALEALARPGRLVDSPQLDGAGWVIGPAAAALCLALVDHETPVWLDAASVGATETLRFHCGCPIVTDAGAAQFVVIGDGAALGPLTRFSAGTDAYPDRSATLIVEVSGLREGGPLRLRGPGIETEHRLTVEGLPEGFWQAWRENGARFPQGADVFLTCGTRFCGLPRTTIVED